MTAQAGLKQRGGLADIQGWFALGRRHLLALAILLAAVAAYHLVVLMRVPEPGVDEAWLASRAYGFIQTGKPFGTMDAGVIDRYDGYWASYPWLLTRLHALAIRALGLSLFTMRSVSLVSGLGLLLAIYAVAAHLGGRRVGLLAVLLTSLSDAFLYSSHLARQDIIVAALGFSAIALYVTDDGPALSARSWLSGLVVALALDIHLTAALYGLAIVLLFLLDHGWAALGLQRFWGFIAGAGAGLLLFLAVHVLPYPQTYMAAVRLLAEPGRMSPPALALDPGVWLESVAGALPLLTWSGKLWFAAPAIVILPKRGTTSARRTVALFAALLLAYVALIRNKTMLYTIMVSPAANILAAAFVVKLLDERKRVALLGDRRTRRALRFLLALVMVVLVLDVLLTNLLQVLNNPMADYRTAVERIKEAVPPGATVMGSQTYWFAMPEQRYLSWEQLVYYQRYAPGSTLEDALREFRPDFLIIDGHMALWIVSSKARAPRYYEDLYLPAPELARFLAKRAHIVTQVYTRSLGNIRVFEIDWS